MELHEHEEKSQHRYEKMMHAIHETKKEAHMSNAPMIFEGGGTGGMGAAMGGGLGAGLLGGLLGGVLFGGGLGGFNRNGNWNGEPPVTSSQLTAALAGVQDTQMNTAVLQELGAIKGMIPAAEGQVQLALAQATGQLSNQLGQQTLTLVGGQANINDNISRNAANIIAVGETTKDLVRDQSAALQVGLTNIQTQGLQNTFAITQAVRDDGEKTRALIVAQNEATLTRQLAVAEATLAEERAGRRAAGTEVNVSQVVNQAQAQAQAQQQQQQQILLLNSIAGHLVGLQNAVATNSNMIIGNTGATTTGAQTANPVNVRT